MMVSVEQVRRAYTARADDYIDLFGSIEATAPEDRQLIARWAAGIDGLILDVGCGPGHWTHFLQESGARVVGLDPVDRFVDSARERYPRVAFREGSAADLGEEDGSVAGVLAWYSLIHTPPERLGTVFSALARALRPGGSALVGFFEGPELAVFDHAVTSAWTWPVPELARGLAQAGLAVTETHTRTDPGQRPHGAAVATRREFARVETSAP